MQPQFTGLIEKYRATNPEQAVKKYLDELERWEEYPVYVIEFDDPQKVTKFLPIKQLQQSHD